MLCFRRSFKLQNDEKFYLTIIFKNITNENASHCQFLQNILSALSREIVFSRANEIADDFGDFLVTFQDFIQIDKNERILKTFPIWCQLCL